MAGEINTCKFYNRDGGCRKDSMKCTHLHVCRNFLLDTCKFGANCKRSHNLNNPDVKQILGRHGIRKKGGNLKRHLKQLLSDRLGFGSFVRASSVKDLRVPAQGSGGKNEKAENDNSSSEDEVQRMKSTSGRNRRRFQRHRSFGQNRTRSMVNLNVYIDDSDSDDSSDADEEGSSLICTFNLKGNCEFGKQCRNQHKDLPYQWQSRRKRTNEPWRDANKAGNEKLENSFCNANDEFCLYQYGKQKSKETRVYFDKIEGDIFDSSYELQFRRLTTPSCKDTTTMFATEWKWYWKTDEGNWKEYGKINKVISSDDLEEKFLENRKGKIRFRTGKGGFEYKINFDKMYQKNIGTKSKRSIRRRPAKHNPADRTGKRLSNAGGAVASSPPASSQLATQFPSTWTVPLGSDMRDHFSKIMEKRENGKKNKKSKRNDTFPRHKC